MQQVKVSIEETQVDFLNNFAAFGFKNKSSMIRTALEQLQRELEQQRLKQSADLYTEIYQNETELSELTESALSGWPE